MLKEKPTLLQARRNYNEKEKTDITTQRLAELSGVSLTDVYLMELGRPVTEEMADKVLRSFSRLTGKNVSLNDIAITVRASTPPDHRFQP